MRNDYKTAEEKAVEWNITPRHVQYLCRMGKVEGALKRAGSWFIPDGTPIPVKNTKSDTKGFRFIGTKGKIFKIAIEMFMTKGFNNVSLSDIAVRVGVRQSTIYNHFKSKQEILDTIYDFYRHYYLENRPSLEEIEPVLQNGSPVEIINCTRYDFKEEHLQQMSDITKIIYQRIAIDDRANEIGKSLMLDEGIRYVEEVFNRGIEIGSFAPFDTHTIAVLINSIRLFTLFNWIVDPSPDSVMKLAKDERMLFEYAGRFLADFKLPAKGE